MAFFKSIVGLGATLLIVGCGGSTDTKQNGGGVSGTTTDGAVTSTGTGGAGTGVGGSGGGSADTTASTGTSTGQGGNTSIPVPAAPQVISLGGSVLAAPKVQLIAYATDPSVSDVEAFITEFGATTEWATQTSEYGVGPFTQLPTILIDGTPPKAFDDDGQPSPFEQTLAANVSGPNPVWGAHDANTMYVFLLPFGTDITSGGHCCSDFYGYHYEAPLASGSVPYGVVCNCPVQQGDPVTALQYLTTTVSHEMVETATDPFVNSNPAFSQTEAADLIWTIATGGEIADMCEYNTDENYQPPGATYSIQRSWSDAAAKAGKNPCVPVASAAPYFNSYAVLEDAITLNYFGNPLMTTGVNIAVGQMKTIDVVLTSPSKSGSWNIKAWDLDDYLGYKANTTVSLDKTSGSDGDVLKLTITVNSYDKSMSGAGFVLESTLDGQDNLTMGAIGQ